MCGVAHEILVSAQGPLVLGFWVWGFGVWGLGLDNKHFEGSYESKFDLCTSVHRNLIFETDIIINF